MGVDFHKHFPLQARSKLIEIDTRYNIISWLLVYKLVDVQFDHLIREYFQVINYFDPSFLTIQWIRLMSAKGLSMIW